MKCNKQLLNSLKSIKDKAIRDQAVKEYKHIARTKSCSYAAIARTKSCSYEDNFILGLSFIWKEAPSGRKFWGNVDDLLLEASK